MLALGAADPGHTPEIHQSQRCLGVIPAEAAVAFSGHTQSCRYVGAASNEPVCGVS